MEHPFGFTNSFSLLKKKMFVDLTFNATKITTSHYFSGGNFNGSMNVNPVTSNGTSFIFTSKILNIILNESRTNQIFTRVAMELLLFTQEYKWGPMLAQMVTVFD